MSSTGQSVSLPSISSLRYEGAPRGQGYDAWREDVRRSICNLDVEPAEGGQINCRIDVAPLASLALANPSGASAQFSRTRELLSDGCDALVLIAAKAGRVLVTQKGRPIELHQSQMCLTDMSVLGTVVINGDSRVSAIRIPRRELLSFYPKAENRLGKPLLENPGLRETIARYLALAFKVVGHLDADGERLTSQHLVGLVGLLLGMPSDETELAQRRGLSAAQLQLSQSDVLNNLQDSDLSTALVARRHGLSPRQVQRLFEQTGGTTFTEFVLEQKLLLARGLLLSPSHRYSKISSIAYDAGFGDLSYFNRAFRRRFGATPSELRNDSRPSGSG